MSDHLKPFDLVTVVSEDMYKGAEGWVYEVDEPFFGDVWVRLEGDPNKEELLFNATEVEKREGR